MARFVRLPRGSWFTLSAILAYALLRGWASLGRPSASFPDSLGYETLSFSGHADRFWPVPLAYSIADSAGARVVLQVLAGAAAWGWLSVVLARRSPFPRVFTVAVLAVGLVPQVVRYDLAMLSESLSISVTVAVVAATLDTVRAPSPGARAVWFVLMCTCAMVRPVHLVVLLACTAWFAGSTLLARERRISILAIACIAAALWGGFLLRENRSTSELNLYTVLAERVITNDARYQWFVDRGMPDVPGARSAEGYDFAFRLPDDLADYVDLPEGQLPPTLVRVGGMDLAQWIRQHGWSTYARYVAEHPSDTWSRVSSLTPRVVDPPNDDFLPVDTRSVVPRWIFQGWIVWSIVGLTSLIAGLVRKESEPAARVIAAMAICGVLVHVATLLTSGIEHERHSVTIAVLLRVLVMAAVANMIAAGTRAPVEPAASSRLP